VAFFHAAIPVSIRGALLAFTRLHPQITTRRTD
jgi:hypothetical protein